LPYDQALLAHPFIFPEDHNRLGWSKMKVKIGDLKPHMENIDVVGRVVAKSNITEINAKKYASATVEDATGQIKLNLWRDQVDEVEVEELILVQKAFVHVRMGEKQLSTWSEIKKASLEDLV
jgi:ssDNA-binding replication factor A large subunit